MQRLTYLTVWTLAAAFYGGVQGLAASDFVLNNARLVVEEVKADPVNEVAPRGGDPAKVVKAPATAPVLELAGPVVFHVDPEQLAPRETREDQQAGQQPQADEATGAVLVSTQSMHLDGEVGQRAFSGVQESFPDWQGGLKPRFIRFGEVW